MLFAEGPSRHHALLCGSAAGNVKCMPRNNDILHHEGVSDWRRGEENNNQNLMSDTPGSCSDSRGGKDICAVQVCRCQTGAATA